MVKPKGIAFIGVGSNIEPDENLIRALELLAKNEALELVGISTIYRTAALRDPEATTGLSAEEPASPDPDFLNAVLAIHTALEPEALLGLFARIEEALGRARDPYQKFAPRTMDLDLLLYGRLDDHPSDPEWQEVGPDGLFFHRDIETRSFVAFPLLELAPDLILPPHRIPLRAITNSFDSLVGSPEPSLTEDLRQRFLPG